MNTPFAEVEVPAHQPAILQGRESELLRYLVTVGGRISEAVIDYICRIWVFYYLSVVSFQRKLGNRVLSMLRPVQLKRSKIG